MDNIRAAMQAISYVKEELQTRSEVAAAVLTDRPVF
jgi:hypothetical protein